MAKLTVWECDHCGKRATQDSMPAKWVKAKVSTDIDSEWLWCGNCWDDFKSVLPQAAPQGKA